MIIEKATDWNDVEPKLRAQYPEIGFNPDLAKYLKNINKMVTELSMLEVQFRRVHKTQMLLSKVEEINKSIKYLEQMAIVAKLYR